MKILNLLFTLTSLLSLSSIYHTCFSMDFNNKKDQKFNHLTTQPDLNCKPGSIFLPQHCWQIAHNNINLFIDLNSEGIISPQNLHIGELVINYSNQKKYYFFAQVSSITSDIITFKRFPISGEEHSLSLNDGKIPQKRFYRLKNLIRWIYQPLVSYDNFLAVTELFKKIPEYSAITPNFKGILLDHDATIVTVGDLHGDHSSLASMLFDLRTKNIIDGNGILKNNYHIVCTGDIADRGACGIECWYILMELAVLNPGKVHIIRGNHEYPEIAKNYGFYTELCQKISSLDTAWEKINQVWQRLPLAFFAGIKQTSAPAYNFLMFSHASINIDRDYTDFLQHVVDGKGKIITHEIVNHENDVNFNWGDFEILEKPSTLETFTTKMIQQGTRGANEQQMDLKAFHACCDQISIISKDVFKLSGIIRGHQHKSVNPCGNIGMLTQDQKAPWKTLLTGKAYKLDRSVVTIISAPHVPEVGCANYNAYATVGMKHDSWCIAPWRPNDVLN